MNACGSLPQIKCMPNEYKLKNFQDVIDKVPTDRIRDCMEELTEVLFQTKAVMELTVAVAANLAAKDGKTLPKEIPPGMLRLPEELTWVDDGKGEVTSVIADVKGQAFAEVTRDMKTGELDMKVPEPMDKPQSHGDAEPRG